MRAETGSVGLAWYPNGQASLSGPALRLFRRLDERFLRLASRWRAEEHRFPPLLPAEVPARLDYFRSFPQLATFPAALDAEPENLARFARNSAVGPEGLALARLAPVRDVLTPAACYHVYPLFEGRELAEPAYVTTLATCFRREERYEPLKRQWSFSMRELVCVGAQEEVEAFLEEGTREATALADGLGFGAAWEQASDPFFNPASPKALFQRVEPVKTELVYRGSLALASVNRHRTAFGSAFRVRRGGETAYSGCIAFGLERWLAAWLETFGAEESAWPRLP